MDTPAQQDTPETTPDASATGLGPDSAEDLSPEQDEAAAGVSGPRVESLEHMRLADLMPYAANSRTHSADQVAQIALSIMEFGFVNPVLIDEHGMIIAGHGRVLAAEELQLESVPCRRISHLTEQQKRAYVIADNQLALNAGWDEETLQAELQALQDDGFDLGLTGFDESELGTLLGVDQDAAENPYTSGVEIPPYEVRGDQPVVTELYDSKKCDRLLQAINDADMPAPVQEFLRAAAFRHVRFNYERIADFYAHADAATQELMEQSALVIIDFDRALQDGYVRLSEKVSEIYQAGQADDSAE
jgi:hypothetical protein